MERVEGTSSTPGESRPGDEILEMNSHRPEVPRDQHAASVGGALQNYWVGSAVWDHTGRPSKVDGWLSAQQAPPDVRVDIRVRLKPNSQASLADLSLLARSNRSTISAGIGCWALNSSKIRSWSFK